MFRFFHLLLGCVFLFAYVLTAGEERPNIVWIVSEDNSALLSAYGDPTAETPHLDQMAEDGFVYENAYATVGVCAPSRFSIITGRQPSSHYGSQGMRGSSRLSESIHFFPKFLREAGYWTANGGKTDYNVRKPGAKQAAWDDNKAHWRDRPESDQPFFKVFNSMITHESRIFPKRWERGGSPVMPETDPDSVELPPYLPDTAAARLDAARYYDRIEALDRWVGGILDQLEEDGLSDDTIVFYYSDHGGVLGRSKRYIYDSGTHVPLIVRFGANFRHLAPEDAVDGRVERLASLMDLGPTVLSLAGIEPPAYTHGKAFLGDYAAPPRKYLMHPRQRTDERIDLSRGIRDGRFLYIRNYLPHWPWGQHVGYMFNVPSTEEAFDLWQADGLTTEQAAFFEPKGHEELYDTEADPHQVHNLAADPAFAEELDRLRRALDARMIATGDTGLFWDFNHEGVSLETAMYQANLAAEGDLENGSKLLEWLQSDSPVTRFWAATGLSILGPEAAPAHNVILESLDDPDPTVRVMLAEALCRMGDYVNAIPVMAEALTHGRGDPSPALWAINVMQLNGPKNFRLVAPRIREAKENGPDHVKWAAPHLLNTMEWK